MQTMEAPPAWEVSALHFSDVMRQLGMYEPSTAGNYDRLSAQLTPGHLELRRLRYLAGGCLIVVIDLLENGDVHVAGLRPVYASSHGSEERSIHACTFKAGHAPTLPQFRRQFLYPFHTLCLRLARKELNRSSLHLVQHVFFQRLLSMPTAFFQYEQSGDGRYSLRTRNCAGDLLTLAYGEQDTAVSAETSGSPGTAAAEHADKAAELLTEVLDANAADVGMLFYCLWSTPAWWLNFAEFESLSMHADAYRAVLPEQYDTGVAARRVQTLGYLAMASMYASIATWNDQTTEEAAHVCQ